MRLDNIHALILDILSIIAYNSHNMNTFDQLESFTIPADFKLAPLAPTARMRVFVGKAWGDYWGVDTTSRCVNKRRGEVMLTALAASLAVIALASCTKETTPTEACTIMVQPGDTLDAIAHGRQSLVADLYEANGNSAAITPGEVLHLDQKTCSNLESIGVVVATTTKD